MTLDEKIALLLDAIEIQNQSIKALIDHSEMILTALAASAQQDDDNLYNTAYLDG